MKRRSLIDEVLPGFQFRSHHQAVVSAPPSAVAEAVETVQLGRGSPLARLLIRLRGLNLPPGTLRESLTAAGFTVLAENPGQELVVGIAGRFWALREQENLVSFRDADDFKRYDHPGHAKAAMSIRMDPVDGRTLLSTETRVQAVDRKAFRRFLPYWTGIRIFSGLIRRAMLRAIREHAEGRA